MAWPKGKPRRGVEQGNASDSEEHKPQDGATEDAPPDDMDGFCCWADERKRLDGVVPVSVSHPLAPEDRRHWDGRYSGYPLTRGPAGVRWSDGSAWPEAGQIDGMIE